MYLRKAQSFILDLFIAAPLGLEPSVPPQGGELSSRPDRFPDQKSHLHPNIIYSTSVCWALILEPSVPPREGKLNSRPDS